MINHKLQTRLMLALIGLLILAAVWSYSQFSRASQEARTAIEETEACQRLAQQIAQLQQRPAVAGSQERQVPDLLGQLEGAAREALIDPDALIKITPETARRVGDSVYTEKPTSLLLRNVTLRQLVTFLHTLSTQDSGLRVRNLQLSAPRDKELGDQWMVDATVSYLIYSPRTEAASSGDKARE